MLTKAADSVFGAEGGSDTTTARDQGDWGDEDLESGEREREKQRKEKLRYVRFCDEGGFDGWLD